MDGAKIKFEYFNAGVSICNDLWMLDGWNDSQRSSLYRVLKKNNAFMEKNGLRGMRVRYFLFKIFVSFFLNLFQMKKSLPNKSKGWWVRRLFGGLPRNNPCNLPDYLCPFKTLEWMDGKWTENTTSGKKKRTPNSFDTMTIANRK